MHYKDFLCKLVEELNSEGVSAKKGVFFKCGWIEIENYPFKIFISSVGQEIGFSESKFQPDFILVANQEEFDAKTLKGPHTLQEAFLFNRVKIAVKKVLGKENEV